GPSPAMRPRCNSVSRWRHSRASAAWSSGFPCPRRRSLASARARWARNPGAGFQRWRPGRSFRPPPADRVPTNRTAHAAKKRSHAPRRPADGTRHTGAIQIVQHATLLPGRHAPAILHLDHGASPERPLDLQIKRPRRHSLPPFPKLQTRRHPAAIINGVDDQALLAQERHDCDLSLVLVARVLVLGLAEPRLVRPV